MPIRRTATSIVVIATLLLAIAAPASATTETTTRGTAATTTVPLTVTVADQAARIGSTALSATTDTGRVAGAPWAGVGVTLLELGDTTFGEVAVDSDGPSSSSEQRVEEDTAVGSVGATTGNMLALADEPAGTATAALTRLSATANVLEGLDVSATITDAVNSVDDNAAVARHTLEVAGIGLDLAGLLGDALETLPLEDLLALADELGVDLSALTDLTAPEDIADAVAVAVAAAQDAADAAGDVTTTATALTDADSNATEPLAGFNAPTLQAHRADLVTALGTATTDPAAALLVVTGMTTDPVFMALGCTLTIPTPPLTEGNVTAATNEAIACIDARLADFQAAVAALADELAAVNGAITAYLDAVTAVTDAVAVLDDIDLAAFLDDLASLLAALADTEVFGTDTIRVTQQVRAVGGDLDASSASTTCIDTATSVLGGTPLPVEGCDVDVTDVVPLQDALGTLFDTVGAVDAGDGITFTLFGIVDNGVEEEADGTVSAVSHVELLRLGVPAISITPCAVADGLLCSIGFDLPTILSDALGDVDTVLDDAFTTVDTTINSGPVADLLDLLDETAPDLSAGGTVETTLETALTAVQSAVTGLDLDGLLSGGDATLPGAMIVVDPELEAEHQVTTASVDGPAAPANPAPGSPANPAPDSPGGDTPTLPNTGGGVALLAVLALGAGAWLWRSRRDEA